MTRRTRVLHVLGRLDIGGAETLLLTLCRRMATDRFEQSVLALSGASGALTPDFAAAGVDEHTIRLTPRVTFPLRLAATLRRLQPDVVVSHVAVGSGPVLATARLAGVRRRIAFFHSDGDGRGATVSRRLLRFLMRLMLKWGATDVAGVTESALRFSGLHGGSSVHTWVISNGVDLERFAPQDRDAARRNLGLPPDALVVTHIGRGAPEKNRRALPKILRCLPSGTRLLMAGSDTMGDLDLTEADPLRARMHNYGTIRDVVPLLAASDALILPSIREGFPMAILESLAVGRPVIAFALPGLREIGQVLPDLCLVPIDASPCEFAETIISTIQQARPADAIRESLVQAGLDSQRMAARWTRLYAGEK